MDHATACTMLGLDRSPGRDQVAAAYVERKAALEQRLASAPTEALKRKYQGALEDLAAARRLLESSAQATGADPGLTADLPAANPSYTRHQFGDGAADALQEQRIRPGVVLAQRYEIREKIGAGGMGAVYRAYDRNRSEEIAVKVLLPQLLRSDVARQRFVAEAKIASSLSHPHIVNVFDVQRDGEFDLLTMELLQGSTLRQLMQQRAVARESFSVEEARAVATAIGGALAYAHRRTLHRDVKPENIWVEEGGGFKLMDFGLARLLSGTNLTATRAAIGSAYYMAPEQIRGSKEIDGRADQYSLGVLLYEMLAGELPTGRVRSLGDLRKDVPRSFSAAVDQAMDPDPARRFADVEQFLQALQRKDSPLDLLRNRNVAIAVAGGVLLLLAVALGPTIVGWLPDRGAAEQARVQAIQAQGIVETLLERVEGEERAIEESVRRAQNDVERLESQVRSARSDAERRELGARLEDARRTAATEQEISRYAVNLIFKSGDLPAARGDIVLGKTALADGDYPEAAQALATAQAKLQAMLDLPDALRRLFVQRDESEVAIRRLAGLVDRERVDATAALDQARGLSARAREALEGGDVPRSSKLFLESAAAADSAFVSAVDTLVARYGEFAQRAMAANRLSEAQVAIDRAKALRAMKSGIAVAPALVRPAASTAGSQTATTASNANAVPPPPAPPPAAAVRTRGARLDAQRSPSPDDFYPPSAKRMGIQGAAVVETCLSASATIVGTPEVVESAGDANLDQAAIAWAQAARYFPRIEDGQAQPGCVKFRVRFALTD